MLLQSLVFVVVCPVVFVLFGMCIVCLSGVQSLGSLVGLWVVVGLSLGMLLGWCLAVVGTVAVVFLVGQSVSELMGVGL